METLSALFSTMWGHFTGAAWFQYVQWPFWTFLFLIALGGVYNARFKKNTLFCRGITGGLKLALIYLCCFGLYRIIPEHMANVSQFPFLSISSTTLTLVNPLGLLDRLFTELPGVLVRLYFLLFLINAIGALDYCGKNFLSWLGSQILTCSASVLLYELLTSTATRIWLKVFDDTHWLYLSAAILLLIPLTVLMSMKLFFIVFRKAGNPTYSTIMQFLTARKFGSLFSVSFFSLLAVLIFLVFISLLGHSRMALANFNLVAYTLIVAMCIGTLFVFSLYYTERKAE